MSLPQTIYFSISNFFYKLTQPNVQCRERAIKGPAKGSHFKEDAPLEEFTR